jgi:DNA repair protein RecN (Recombination protein N)
VEEVLEEGARLSEELRRLKSAREDEEQLNAEVERLKAELKEVAGELHSARVGAASRFESRMTGELSALNMSKAQFRVALTDRTCVNGDVWGPSGTDEVEFLFSSNAGEQARPLAKIASGGEISRVMLAAKVVLGSADDVPTLVFDEIDSGVGGKTAAAVGAKLAALASDHQVICVTHLPQIASVAARHLSVAKSEEGGRTKTSVVPVEGERRVEEVARMLSGAKMSETSLQHAREMLAGG